MAPGREKVALHPRSRGREIQTRHGSATVRRLAGPRADELFLLCRPGAGAGNVGRQAEIAYETMLEVLHSERVAPEALVSETVFFRRVGEDLEAVLAARRRALGGAGNHCCSPATTFIGEPPIRREAALEVAAVAVVPHPHESCSAFDVRRAISCPCEACAPGARARVLRIGDQAELRAGNIHGAGRGAFEQAYDMFCVAKELLSQAQMTFGDVVRTWIHLRDIGRDYEAFNQARREFFRDCGIERKPASTGVQGIPFPAAHDFSLSLHAVTSHRPLEITAMSSTTLNEAWSYGADFSRGLKVVDANKQMLHVSGTASIGEAGETVAIGDFAAQVDQMLRNIASLLAGQGATFSDVVSAVTYLKNPSDASALRAMFRSHGFVGFPCAVVEAPLCRPELLCETEAVAIVPPAGSGA